MAFEIYVNHVPVTVKEEELSYEDVMKIAYPELDPSTIMSLVYHRGGDRYEPDGSITPGRKMKVRDGTVIYVVDTSNA